MGWGGGLSFQRLCALKPKFAHTVCVHLSEAFKERAVKLNLKSWTLFVDR